MRNKAVQNIVAGGFSLLLHLVLIGPNVFGMETAPTHIIAAPAKVDIVQATVMDEDKVLEEMARQQEFEDKKRQTEKNRQEKIDQKLADAQQELKRKEKEIAKKKEQAKIEQQQRDLTVKQEQEKIVELEKARKLEEKKKQQAEKERLAEEEKQREAEQARKEAEEQRKLEAEQARKEAEEKQRKAEQKRKVEQEKQRLAEKKRKAEEARKLEADRLLKESLAAEAREREEGRVADVVANHAYIIQQRVKRYWIKPNNIERGLKCTLQVSLLPDGDVKQVSVIEGSGNANFDRSAETAVYKAAPLPMPTDKKAAVQFRKFKFIFKPE